MDTMHRRSIRLQGYDYAQDGAHFVTLLTYRRAHVFGDVVDGEMVLSTLGCVADACWCATADHFPGVMLDAYVVMPNHLHGIVIIHRWEMQNQNLISAAQGPSETADVPIRAMHASPLQPHTMRPNGPKPGSLAAIIGSYKAAAARQINQVRQTPGEPVWHRSYYEHIIRSEDSLNRIRAYILDNPARWSADAYYVET